MAEQRLIDIDTLKEKEQYIPCGNGLLFHGVTAATIDAMPTVNQETLPIVLELRAEIERLKTDGKQDVWAVERKRRESAEEKLKRVTAERDAAMSFIPKTCATCKYGKSPCDWCGYDPDGDLNWEWNGKAKEDANE